MSSVYPWIYVDYMNNVWKFFKTDNKELRYNIMYGEGKWTKENLVAKDVLGFAVYAEEKQPIHIVYSNSKGELIYCTIRDEVWVGKKLYEIEKDNFEIQNLKIEVLGDEMHIFFLLISNDDSDNGTLMHFIWKGSEKKITLLQDIILMPETKEYYSVNINDRKNINIFFITDEGGEVSLKHSIFQNGIWTPAKRIYGIQGDDISFEVIMYNQEIHILNKCRENSMYFIDHVFIDKSGDTQGLRVYKSKNKLIEPLLFIKSNKIYCSWIEKGKIAHSLFDYEKWGSPVYFDSSSNYTLNIYNYFICNGDESSIKLRKVYGNNEIDLKFFLPSHFIIDEKDSIKHDEKIVDSLKLELSQVKSERKNLEKKIAYLSMQLQKKQRFMEDYEEQVGRILEQKRKADENSNVFLEMQQSIQKELSDTKQELNDTQQQLNSIKEELSDIKQQLNDANQQLLEERSIKASMENRIKAFEEEKNKLYEELELEKNKSIMERLLGRKSSGV